METYTIPAKIFQTIRMSPSELMIEIAVMLFQKDKITLGQASELCGLSQYEFQHFLSSRRIDVHFDVDEFESDLKTLKKLGRI